MTGLVATSYGSWGQISATGDVALGNATLSIIVGLAVVPGDSFAIVQASGQLSGTFQGLPNGTIFTIGGKRFSIAYTATSAIVTRLIDDFSRQQDDAPFDLFATTGQPPGTGTFSGPGVTNGIFSPMGAGPGIHTITFTQTRAARSPSTSRSTKRRVWS